MRKKIIAVLISVFFTVAASMGWALSLAEAKQQGLVGEQSNGYLGAVGTANAEVLKLIQQVNNKRKSKYRDIAKRNSTDLPTVEKLAGKKAIEKTPKGLFIKVDSTNWRRK